MELFKTLHKKMHELAKLSDQFGCEKIYASSEFGEVEVLLEWESQGRYLSVSFAAGGGQLTLDTDAEETNYNNSDANRIYKKVNQVHLSNELNDLKAAVEWATQVIERDIERAQNSFEAFCTFFSESSDAQD